MVSTCGRALSFHRKRPPAAASDSEQVRVRAPRSRLGPARLARSRARLVLWRQHLPCDGLALSERACLWDSGVEEWHLSTWRRAQASAAAGSAAGRQSRAADSLVTVSPVAKDCRGGNV